MSRSIEVTALSPDAQERLTRPVREKNRDDRTFIYVSPQGTRIRLKARLTAESMAITYGGYIEEERRESAGGE